ncbi:MAG: hypothetical protein AABM64_10565 [Pseudomonadota bacterium]
MPSKPKSKVAPKETRNALKVALRHKDENPDDATARTLTRPEVQAAATIQKWEGDSQEVNALARELTAQVAAVNGGDLLRAEGMLIAQAHTLDALFNNLARRAHGQEYLLQYETYMRLALKTQSQCRATLETLAAIKNPPSVAFVRQANIASGPQQVNNGIPASSRAREIESEQNKLLELQHGERLDTGTAGTTGGADPALATVAAIHRAENKGG